MEASPSDHLQNADFLILLFIFARVAGIFLLSPLLAGKGISLIVRGFLTVGTTILLTMVVYPSYHGQTLIQATWGYKEEVFLGIVATFKEVAVGYLIGFCFSLLFEAMILAGETIDSMTGLSTAQFFDPLSQTFKSLLAQLFLFSAVVLMFVMDLHHVFFRVIAESLKSIPLGYYQIPHPVLKDVTLTASAIFVFAIKIAAIPILILVLTAVSIGFVSRALPEFNPLITGLSIRIVVGLFAVAITLKLFPALIENAFASLTVLAQNLLAA